MKWFPLLFLLFLFQSCCPGKKEDILSAVIPTRHLQEDLAVLQEIITKVHAGAYAFNTPAQLSHLFDSLSGATTDPMDIRAFYNEVNLVTDRLGCSHSEVYLPDDYYDSLSVKAWFFPLPLLTIDNKIYLNSAEFNVPLGAEILSVNNYTAAELIRRLGPYYHTDGCSNNRKCAAIGDDFAYNFYCAYGPQEAFTIRYRDSAAEGVQTKIFMPQKLNDIYNSQYQDTYYSFPTDASYDFEMMDDAETAVLTVRTFLYGTYTVKSAFSHFLENSFRLIRQNHIKNLILDCRNNGGGYYSGSYLLSSYLVNEKLNEYDSAIKRYDKLPLAAYVDIADTSRITEEDTSAHNYTEIRQGIYREKETQIAEWAPKDLLFKGRLFVIIDKHVCSATSNLAAILQDKRNAFIVGEESGGGHVAHNASAIDYVLPHSRIKVRIPTRRFYQPVNRHNPARGVIPDKTVPFL